MPQAAAAAAFTRAPFPRDQAAPGVPGRAERGLLPDALMFWMACAQMFGHDRGRHAHDRFVRPH